MQKINNCLVEYLETKIPKIRPRIFLIEFYVKGSFWQWTKCKLFLVFLLFVFILDLGGQEILHVANVVDVVFDH